MSRRVRPINPDPELDDLDFNRRRRTLQPPPPVQIVLPEPVFFNDMRDLNRIYGRNFRNLMRKKVELRLVEELPRFDTYLEDFPIEELLGWLNKSLMNPRWVWRIDEFQYLRVFTGDELNSKQECIARYEQCEEKEDWKEWHQTILRDCLYLNERYPQHFARLLEAFLLPIHTDLCPRSNEENEDTELEGIQNDSGEIEEEIEEEEEEEDLFRKWLEILDGYQHSEFCGYMFKVLDPWLVGARVALNNSLSDFYPHFGRKLNQFGALPGQFPKMEILHDPTFREIREWMKIQTERPYYDEPLLPKSHIDYMSKREGQKRGDHLFGPPRLKKKVVLTEPTFQISRPFPSKGGFTKKFLKNDKLDIIKKSNSRKY